MYGLVTEKETPCRAGEGSAIHGAGRRGGGGERGTEALPPPGAAVPAPCPWPRGRGGGGESCSHAVPGCGARGYLHSARAGMVQDPAGAARMPFRDAGSRGSSTPRSRMWGLMDAPAGGEFQFGRARSATLSGSPSLLAPLSAGTAQGGHLVVVSWAVFPDVC